ncbi:MAG: hypothetical protein AB1768_20195 [Pseudomonadota bacterium]
MKPEDLDELEGLITGLRHALRQKEMAAGGRVRVRHPIFGDEGFEIDVPPAKLGELNARVNELRQKLKDKVKAL